MVNQSNSTIKSNMSSNICMGNLYLWLFFDGMTIYAHSPRTRLLRDKQDRDSTRAKTMLNKTIHLLAYLFQLPL